MSRELHEWVRERRRARASDDAPGTQAQPCEAGGTTDGRDGQLNDLWGLALSGGGVRSAVFSYGLIRALAKRDVLPRFDVWSTVSGGGYIGAAIGKLFHHAESKHQVDAVYASLKASNAPWFTWWLRANSRYLIPRGFKDSAYAAAQYTQNLIGLHAEVGMQMLVLGLMLVAFNAVVWTGLAAWPSARAVASLVGVESRWLPTLWLLWVPLAILAMAFTAAACCVGPVNRHERRGVPRAAALATGAMLTAALLCWQAPTAVTPSLHKVVWALALGIAVAVALAGWARALATRRAIKVIRARKPSSQHTPWRGQRVRGVLRDEVRHQLMNCLSGTGRAAGVVMVLGMLDRAAWYVAFEMQDIPFMATLVVVATVALRAALPILTPTSGSMRPMVSGWLVKAGHAVGYALAAMIATLWLALIDRLLYPFDGEVAALWAQRRGFGLVVVAAVLAFVWATRHNFAFLNQSSLHNYYRARITRAFLGAANGLRYMSPAEKEKKEEEVGPPQGSRMLRALEPLGNEPLEGYWFDKSNSVNDVHATDDVEMSSYAPHRLGGPVHLLGVCVNETTDRRGGLFNQDRRGQMMLVGPQAHMRVGRRAWQQAASAGAGTLGRWVAVSGAAVAPGAGHYTRGGFSALATLVGLRLGYWWNSSWLTRDARAQSGADAHGAGAAHARCDRNYKLVGLASELRGGFSAEAGRFWYLSDGGHYENTGALALLAERAKVIVLADCGADPRFRFRDLENLVRKARIDLNADIHFMHPDPAKRASREAPGGNLEAFGTLDDLASNKSNACLALARIEYHDEYHGKPSGQGWLVVVKPNLSRDAPADLFNFKADNPAFPQETTTDQSFSEAQWESYYKLGSLLGHKLSRSFLESLDDWASCCFVDDRGAAACGKRQTGAHTPNPDGSAATTAAAGKDAPAHGEEVSRLPSRISTGAVATTLGAGAALTLALSLWQSVDGTLSASTQRDTSTRARTAFFQSYGKWALAADEGVGKGAKAVNDTVPTAGERVVDKAMRTTLGEAAAAALPLIDGACGGNGPQLVAVTPMLRCMLVNVEAGCKQPGLGSHQAGCLTLVSSSDLSCVLGRAEGDRPMPYWGRVFPKKAVEECPALHAINRALGDEPGRAVEGAAHDDAHDRDEVDDKPSAVPDAAPQARDAISPAAVVPASGLHRPAAGSMQDHALKTPLAASAASEPPAALSRAHTLPRDAVIGDSRPVPKAARAAPTLSAPARVAPVADQRARSPCVGITIDVQAYGQTKAAEAARFAARWREQGAYVPQVEDLHETARRKKLAQPAPSTTKTRIEYAGESAEACASHLRQDLREDLRDADLPVPLRSALSTRHNSVMVRFAP